MEQAFLGPALDQQPRGHARTDAVSFSSDAVLPFDGNQQTVADSAVAASFFLRPRVSWVHVDGAQTWRKGCGRGS